jgi:hypothetical protein
MKLTAPIITHADVIIATKYAIANGGCSLVGCKKAHIRKMINHPINKHRVINNAILLNRFIVFKFI